MQDGTLSRDSLNQLMRSLSRKRRQGLLEITSDEVGLSVQFLSGKIVSVTREGEAASLAVLERLRRAGCISDSMSAELGAKELALQNLYDHLIENDLLSHEDFFLAKEAYERDMLHRLRELEGDYRFRPRIVKIDERLALHAFPAQLLLDFIELDHGEQRFEEVFDNLSSEEVLIKRSSEEAIRLTPNEQTVFDNLEVETCLKDVHDAALLCEFALREALLSLYDRDLISTRHLSDFEEDLPNGLPFRADSPEQLIEEAANLLSDIEPDAEFVRVKPNLAGGEVYTSATVVQTIDPEALVERRQESTELTVIGAKTSEVSEHKPPESETPFAQDVKSQFITWNYMLLDKHGMGTSTLFVLLAFMVCIALIVPGLFEVWFEALGNFSSLR